MNYAYFTVDFFLSFLIFFLSKETYRYSGHGSIIYWKYKAEFIEKIKYRQRLSCLIKGNGNGSDAPFQHFYSPFSSLLRSSSSFPGRNGIMLPTCLLVGHFHNQRLTQPHKYNLFLSFLHQHHRSYFTPANDTYVYNNTVLNRAIKVSKLKVYRESFRGSNSSCRMCACVN